LSPARLVSFDLLVKEFKKAKKNIVEKVNIALILESKRQLQTWDEPI
jgi:hypothetical protein